MGRKPLAPRRYLLCPSNIGWQVRDRETHGVVEWPGGWAVYPKRAEAEAKRNELEAAPSPIAVPTGKGREDA